MTLSPKLSIAEISTLWHFGLPLPIQMFIKVASSPRLSGIGMPSPILWSHPLKMQRIVLLSSLLWRKLGTNSLITGPGEWLSFRRFTSKLSWSWPMYNEEKLGNKTTITNLFWATVKNITASGDSASGHLQHLGVIFFIITQPTIYRVIGYFLMSNVYFAVATDSQFDLVFKACDEATVKTIDRSTFWIITKPTI